MKGFLDKNSYIALQLQKANEENNLHPTFRKYAAGEKTPNTEKLQVETEHKTAKFQGDKLQVLTVSNTTN